MLTLIRLFTGVRALMRCAGSRLYKLLAAKLALIGSVARMVPFVDDKLR